MRQKYDPDVQHIPVARLQDQPTEAWITFLKDYPGYTVDWHAEYSEMDEVEIDHIKKTISLATPGE